MKTFIFHKHTNKRKRIEQLERFAEETHDRYLELCEAINLLEEYLDIKQHQPNKSYVKRKKAK